MSRIFDALQKSEGERSGVDLSTLTAATELLQLVERNNFALFAGADFGEIQATPLVNDVTGAIGRPGDGAVQGSGCECGRFDGDRLFLSPDHER